jgi:hypothetical protein
MAQMFAATVAVVIFAWRGPHLLSFAAAIIATLLTVISRIQHRSRRRRAAIAARDRAGLTIRSG